MGIILKDEGKCIAHTGPTCLLEEIQKQTDFDAAEVHLFDIDKNYYSFYKQASRMGRQIYLNCSSYQIKEQYDFEKYFHYIQDLQPAAYVVPDVRESSKGTIANFKKWMKKYDKKIGDTCKAVGVVHGETYEDFLKCYTFMKENADRIAFSWDCSLYELTYMDGKHSYATPMEDVLTYGRENLLKRIYEEGHIQSNIPHDLLGTCHPWEARAYKMYVWVHAVITSHPVISGMAGWKYQRHGDADHIFGVPLKSNTRLTEIYDDTMLSSHNFDKIMHNIKWFRYTVRA